MQKYYRTIVQLPCDNGLPEDTYNNDWYFHGLTNVNSETEDIDNIVARLAAFYNSVPTGDSKSISDYLGPQISTTSLAAKFVVYAQNPDDQGDPWGSPFSTRSWTVGTPDSSTPLPAEVAVVLSYHGDLTNIPETAPNPTPPPAIIRPAARRRGRLYLGPLNATAGVAQSPSNDLGVLAIFRDTIAAAALDLSNLNGTDDLEWVVYSLADLDIHDVVGGFVDSAFDIQRRRGTAAVARDTWGA